MFITRLEISNILVFSIGMVEDEHGIVKEYYQAMG